MWVGAGSVSPAVVVRHLGPQLLAVAAGAARRARRRRGREEVCGGVERVGGGRRGGGPPAGAVARVGRAAGHRAPCSKVDTSWSWSWNFETMINGLLNSVSRLEIGMGCQCKDHNQWAVWLPKIKSRPSIHML